MCLVYTVEAIFTVYNVTHVETIFTVYNVTHVEAIFTVHYDRAAPKLCLCDVGVDLPCIWAITSTDEYYFINNILFIK